MHKGVKKIEETMMIHFVENRTYVYIIYTHVQYIKMATADPIRRIW